MRKIVILVCVLFLFVAGGCGDDKDNSSLPSSSESSSSSSSSSEPVQMSKIAVIKGAGTGLNVRDAASMDSNILGTAYDGDKFRLMKNEQDGDWFQIFYGGKTAYLFHEFVDVQEITSNELKAIIDAETSTGSSSEKDSGSSSEDSVSNSASPTTAPDNTSTSSGSPLNTRDTEDIER